MTARPFLIETGTAYRSETIFDLNKMQPYPLHVLVSNFSKLTRDIVLYLPRSADLHQLAKLENNSRNLTVIHYCMDGASKVQFSSSPIIFALTLLRPFALTSERSHQGTELSAVGCRNRSRSSRGKYACKVDKTECRLLLKDYIFKDPTSENPRPKEEELVGFGGAVMADHA